MYYIIYHNLCQSRKNLREEWIPGSGIHAHHIIPKHHGGGDEIDNITYLTVREHQIAHFLLWKLYRMPNDLRAMYMLGANLTPAQRRITGEWCRDNKIGIFGATDTERKKWRNRGIDSQKNNGDTNSFYWWSTAEGRKKRASMGGKASIFSGNNKEWIFWNSSAGRKKRASMGGKSHKGKKCMYRPGDKTFIRVKNEDIPQRLNEGYIFGSPINPRASYI